MPSQTWSMTCMRAASDNSGYDLSRVESIASNRNSPCRSMTAYDYKVGSLGAIQRVAVDFCGADPLICTGAIKECSNLFASKFGRLSLAEIREAFSMCAARQLGDINIIAYKGVFTAGIFGEVISAYAAVRDAVVAALDKEAEKEEREALDREVEAKQEQCKKDVIAEFQAAKISNTRFISVDKIPIQWPGILKDAGLLESDPKLWVEAKNATKDKFKADTRKIKELRVLNAQQADKLESMAFTMTDRERIGQQMFENPDVLPEELFIAATQLYGRMLVFKQLAQYVQPTHQLFI